MNTETTKKPKWQRRLERESWQAELIISGAAIFGASLLPDLLNQLEVWLLLNIDNHTLEVWSLIMMYFRAATTLILVVFVFHFIVRALWIGMVGLNSVFPGGFRRVEYYSDYYQDRMRERFGDINGFIARLDRLSSGIFGAGFTVVSVFLNLGLLGAIYAGVYRVLFLLGVPTAYLEWIGTGLLSLLIILGIVSTYLGQKRFHGNERMNKLHYELTASSGVMFLVNRRFTLIGLTLLSYTFIDRKGYPGYLIGGSFGIALLLAFTDFKAPHQDYFRHDSYYRNGTDSTLVCGCNYADSGFGGIYYSPVIPAKTMAADDLLSVFVPLPEREWDYLERQCERPGAPESLSREERRAYNQQRWLGCMDDYITVSLNGRRVRHDDLIRTWRTTETATQFGAEFTYYDAPFRRGKNMLEVTTRFPHWTSDSTFRTTNVPFYVK